MIQVTKNRIQEFYHCPEKDDYFYTESHIRVPDELRKGFNTTIFRRSDQNPNAIPTPISVLNEKMKKLGITIS